MKQEINVNEKTMKVVNLLKELFLEIEKIVHFKINHVASKEDIDDLYVKINTSTHMCFEVSLLNSKTNSLVIKTYNILDLIALCQLNMVDTAIDLDIKELYNTSKVKVYDVLTEILI